MVVLKNRDERELSKNIEEKLTEVADVFSMAQSSAGLICPGECAKCCFKSDIYCSPYELLPMAYHLIDRGEAEEVLEKARLHIDDHCLFLDISDKIKGHGRCREYQHRPFICRAFGHSARVGKYDKRERSICKTLSELEANSPQLQIIESEIPLIDLWKKQVESIDPRLLIDELPIHQSLIFILEKLLLWESLSERS